MPDQKKITAEKKIKAEYSGKYFIRKIYDILLMIPG